MPIVADNARMSIEFSYDFETPDGPVNYQMKFMHTEQGPVIQILDPPYETVTLPAAMFTEVAEFLISQRVIKGFSPATIKAPLSVPSIARQPRAEAPSSPQLLSPSLLRLGRTSKPSATVAVDSSAEPISSLETEQAPPGMDLPEDGNSATSLPDAQSLSEMEKVRLAAKAKANAVAPKMKFRSNPKLEGAGGENTAT